MTPFFMKNCFFFVWIGRILMFDKILNYQTISHIIYFFQHFQNWFCSFDCKRFNVLSVRSKKQRGRHQERMGREFNGVCQPFWCALLGISHKSHSLHMVLASVYWETLSRVVVGRCGSAGGIQFFVTCFSSKEEV